MDGIYIRKLMYTHLKLHQIGLCITIAVTYLQNKLIQLGPNYADVEVESHSLRWNGVSNRITLSRVVVF